MAKDEFDSPRKRRKQYPAIKDYFMSRDMHELARLIWDKTEQCNIFGTYPGTSGEHAMAMIEVLLWKGRHA